MRDPKPKAAPKDKSTPSWLTVKPQKLTDNEKAAAAATPPPVEYFPILSGLLQEKNRRQVLLLPQFQKALSRQTALLV
jgi:hypothetical protein